MKRMILKLYDNMTTNGTLMLGVFITWVIQVFLTLAIIFIFR